MTLRETKGQDIAAACGQLRAENQLEKNKITFWKVGLTDEKGEFRKKRKSKKTKKEI